MKSVLSAVGLVLLLLVLTPRTAHAYLDPASGSMILQMIVAAVAAAAIAFSAFWHRIRGLFGGRPVEEKTETGDDLNPSDGDVHK